MTTPQTSTVTHPAQGEDVLIVLPVRNLVLFPGAVSPVALSREVSVAGAQEAVRTERKVGFLLQRDAELDLVDRDQRLDIVDEPDALGERERRTAVAIRHRDGNLQRGRRRKSNADLALCANRAGGELPDDDRRAGIVAGDGPGNSIEDNAKRRRT